MNLKCIFCDVVFPRENLGKTQEQLHTIPSFNRIAVKYFGLNIETHWDLTLICLDSNSGVQNEGIKVPLPLCVRCAAIMIKLIDLDTQLECVQSEISTLVAQASLSIINKLNIITNNTTTTKSTQDSISVTVQTLQNDESEILNQEINTTTTTFQEEQQHKEFNFVRDVEYKSKVEPGFEISIDIDKTQAAESNNELQVHVIDVDNNSQAKEHDAVVDDLVSEKIHSLRKIIFDHYKPQVVLSTCDTSQDDSPRTFSNKSIKKTPKKRKRGRPKKEPVKVCDKVDNDSPEFSISNTPEKNGDCKDDVEKDNEAGEEMEIEEEYQDDYDDDPDYSNNNDDITSQRPSKRRKMAKKTSSSTNKNKNDNTMTKKQFRSTKEIENGIHLYRKWTFKEVETGFFCLTCPLEKQKVRKNRQDCIKHINKRHNMDRARCDRCRRSYRNEKLLESHECHPKVITRVYRVKNVGGGKFLYDNKFEFEQIGNTVEYKCSTCSVIKRGHGYITTHIKETHAEPTKHLCKECGKSFEKLKLFKNHQTTHSDFCAYTCESCGKQCKTQGLLKAHQMMHASLAFKCDTCARSFKYKKSLNRHRKDAGHPELVSNVDTRPLHALSCNLCHKKFLTQKSMDLHALSCTGVPKFPCYLCPKFFIKRSYIAKHINLVHNKDKQQVENISNGQKFNSNSAQVIETKDIDDVDIQKTLLESTKNA